MCEDAGPPSERCVCVLVRTDNSAAASVLMTGRTRDPILALCARVLAMYIGLRQWQVLVTHVPGVSLILADALSRYTLSKRYENIVHEKVGKRSLIKVQPVDVMKILDSVV